jgi:hypothetical protein
MVICMYSSPFIGLSSCQIFCYFIVKVEQRKKITIRESKLNFVSDLRQVGAILRGLQCPPPIQLIATIKYLTPRTNTYLAITSCLKLNNKQSFN